MTATGPAEPTRGRGRPRGKGGRDYMTVREAAESQGVSEDAIRWHIRRGHIPVLRVGARVHIPRAAYQAQLQGVRPETLTGLLGLHREELEEIVAGAVSRALREMFGVLAEGRPQPQAPRARWPY